MTVPPPRRPVCDCGKFHDDRDRERDRPTWSPIEPPGCHDDQCPYLATYCPNHNNRFRVALFHLNKGIERARLSLQR